MKPIWCIIFLSILNPAFGWIVANEVGGNWAMPEPIPDQTEVFMTHPDEKAELDLCAEHCPSGSETCQSTSEWVTEEGD